VSEQIYILDLANRHGSDLSAHRTEQGVRNAIYSYVVESWHDWFGDKPVPEDIEEAIEEYYEASLDEDYSVATVDLED